MTIQRSILQRQRTQTTLQQLHILLPFLVYIVLVTNSISSSTVFATKQTDWVSDCKENGFHPEQLACQTCYVLKEQVQQIPQNLVNQCLQCCQNWLDIKRITKPYSTAIVIDRGSGGEVETFFKENWEEVLSAKGDHQIHKITTGKEHYNFFQLRPSQVLFFHDPKIIKHGKVTHNVTTLTQLAVEVVNLDGMKREDMKDMLLTLLP